MCMWAFKSAESDSSSYTLELLFQYKVYRTGGGGVCRERPGDEYHGHLSAHPNKIQVVVTEQHRWKTTAGASHTR